MYFILCIFLGVWARKLTFNSCDHYLNLTATGDVPHDDIGGDCWLPALLSSVHYWRNGVITVNWIIDMQAKSFG